MRIAVLAGGVGGAKFLLGVKAVLGWAPFGPPTAEQAGRDQVTAIVNTADDIRLHNLQICPDLDSCLYTLSGAADLARGWGREHETWTVSTELTAYSAEAPWFSLGDKDIATHLVRTRMLDAGYRLSAVTEALCARWQPGVALLPMTDDRVETHVIVHDPVRATIPDAKHDAGQHAKQDAAQAPNTAGTDPAGHGGPTPSGGGLTALHFQEWWIRYRAGLPAVSITPVGADESSPAPGVLEAIADADLVLVAPSNPVVSVGTILAVPGITEAIRSTAAPVVGVSPLIGGRPVRGHADACLAAIGVDCTAEAVGRHYGARSVSGLLDAYLVAEGEGADIPGVRVVEAPLLMSDPAATSAMVRACAEAADVRL